MRFILILGAVLLLLAPVSPVTAAGSKSTAAQAMNDASEAAAAKLGKSKKKRVKVEYMRAVPSR